jgi:hypothetical protein
MHYAATLHRGWTVVRLDYTLEGDAIRLRRQAFLQAPKEQRVELAALSGEVRRIWARQPAYIISTIIIVLAFLVLAIDGVIHGVRHAGDINWALWGPIIAVGGFALVARVKTARPAEWSHFVGTNKGTGMYVLKDPRNPKAHEMFVAAIRERLPEKT